MHCVGGCNNIIDGGRLTLVEMCRSLFTVIVMSRYMIVYDYDL